MPLASIASPATPTLAVRNGIAWGLEAPSEDSSVLVTGTPSGHYIDIRFALSGPSTEGPFWAFSGKSTYTTLASSSNAQFGGWGQVIRGEWAHPIDSMGNFDGTDKADVIELGNGDQVEFGLLEHPETGEPSQFKEYWTRPEGYNKEDDETWARAVFEEDGKLKGVLIKAGRWVQGIIQMTDNEVRVGRWKLDGEWILDNKSSVGPKESFDVDWLVDAKRENDTVQVDGRSWKIVEESQ